MTSQEQFTRKLVTLKRKLVDHDKQLATIFDAMGVSDVIARQSPKTE